MVQTRTRPTALEIHLSLLWFREQTQTQLPSQAVSRDYSYRDGYDPHPANDTNDASSRYYDPLPSQPYPTPSRASNLSPTTPTTLAVAIMTMTHFPRDLIQLLRKSSCQPRL